ncbi:hypothetical protein CCO03_11860 [Comamonas serinivorans]|uniref:NADPH--hemoprotein reductase n=1 Tax=Comamonas serinivorans TaxID=1082851 RepID=A0A1Y0EPU5_9BURK|nr:NADPH cytochrome P450 oxidoreductase family protein [Comamonas serinivorans]ARU05282.1 hypothetical protein CCO03_11860 [Comamonas serinivorans]
MTARLMLALALVLAYAAVCARIAWRWRQGQADQRARVQAVSDPRARTLVVHGSQGGTAEQLALQTAQGLRAQGQAVRLLALNAVTPATLTGLDQLWLVVSTYGEGDAPDGASVFADAVMGQPDAAHVAPWPALRFGVLALGDRQYAQFCAFGHRVHRWLGARGAQAAFAPVEVDNGDPAALARWQALLGLAEDDVGLAGAPFARWTLSRREHLNPGSQGHPLHALTLLPADGPLPTWQAGDLLQLLPEGDEAGEAGKRPREYSIASTPAQGSVCLLVRHAHQQDEQGQWHQGLASSQLCGLPPGSTWRARIKPHAGFRIGPNAERPLVLIGNGSGLAGLHAHILAREGQAAPWPGIWLIYGERQRAHDAAYAPTWQTWLDQGLLSRLDLSYSRDGEAVRHVQDLVRQQADRLRDWVARDAAIYVCGSLHGMAGDVDAALRAVLGDGEVRHMLAAGRYRRDVY